MQFEYPVFLILGVVATVGFLALAWRTHRNRQRALSRFAAAGLSKALTANVSPGRRRLKTVLLAVAMMAIFTAAARPQVGYRWEEVKRRGIDILLALDTSKSMLATDVVPSRLERAKLGIEDLTERLDGDRCGLLPFSGRAFLFCPLTLDMDAFRESLRAVDERIIPDPGTDLAEAIREARAALAQGANHKILVLVTDGEDLEGQALEEAERAAAEGITIHTVGVGTPGGETIPLRRPDGSTTLLRDADGQVVTSRLDEDTLRTIASLTGGVYARLGRGGAGLDAIYDQSLSLVPKQDLTQRRQKIPLERYAWPLALGVLALLLEFVLGDRKRRVKADRRSLARGAAGRAAAALLVVALAGTVAIRPARAEAASSDGSPIAPTVPDRQEDPRLRYNHGVAAYEQARWDDAIRWLESVLPAGDLSIQSRAYYGLGNALFRKGQQTESEDPQQTIQLWERALRQYDGALALVPDDADAAFNRDVVQQHLDALKERQEQEQEQEQEEPEDPPQQDQQPQDPQDEPQQDPQQPDPACDAPGEGQEGEEGEEGDASSSASAASAEGEASGERADAPPGEDTAPHEASATEAEERRDDEAPPADAPTESAGEPQEAKPDGQGGRPGQMTGDEARLLLDSLEENEGSLRFVPQRRRTPPRKNDSRSRRDW